MRTVLGLSLLALTACGQQLEPLELEPPTEDGYAHVSTVYARTSGVAFDADGSSLMAGMYGLACQIDVRSGSIDADLDPSWEDEKVDDRDDASDEGGPDHMLSVHASGVTVFDTVGPIEDIAAPGALHARFTDAGVAVLRDEGDCRLLRTGGGETALDAEVCAGANDLAISEDGTAWIAHGRLTAAGLDGPTSYSHPATRVRYDAAMQALFTSAGPQVAALSPRGEVRWQQTLADPITGLAAYPAANAVAVSLSHEDGSGTLVVLDAATGEVRSEHALRNDTREIAIAEQGDVVALVRESHVHFIELVE